MVAVAAAAVAAAVALSRLPTFWNLPRPSDLPSLGKNFICAYNTRDIDDDSSLQALSQS